MSLFVYMYNELCYCCSWQRVEEWSSHPEPVYIFPPSSIPVYENIFVLIVGGACVWSYINVLTLIAQCSCTFMEDNL